MLAAVELKTLRLVRWSIGTLQLGALEVGQHVHLTRGEVTALRNLVQDQPNVPEKSYTPRKIGRRTIVPDIIQHGEEFSEPHGGQSCSPSEAGHHCR